MTITMQTWHIVTIIYVVLSIVLARQASRQHGWFGGAFEAMMWFGLTFAFIVYLITHFLRI